MADDSKTLSQAVEEAEKVLKDIAESSLVNVSEKELSAKLSAASKTENYNEILAIMKMPGIPSMLAGRCAWELKNLARKAEARKDGIPFEDLRSKVKLYWQEKRPTWQDRDDFSPAANEFGRDLFYLRSPNGKMKMGFKTPGDPWGERAGCIPFMEKYFKIPSKDQGVIPYRINPPQRLLARTWQGIFDQSKTANELIELKARQWGSTTWHSLLNVEFNLAYDGCASGIVADDKGDALTKCYDLMNANYMLLPFSPFRKSPGSSQVGINFDRMASRTLFDTAGTANPLTGATTQFQLLTEVAKWPPGSYKRVMASIGPTFTRALWSIRVWESTAYGQNEFFDLWQRKGLPHLFIPWYIDSYYEIDGDEKERFAQTTDRYFSEFVPPEHRNHRKKRWFEQMLEGPDMNGDQNKFNQEYPAIPEIAFATSGSSFFDLSLVMQGWKKCEDPAWRGRIGTVELGIDKEITLDSLILAPDPTGPLSIWVQPEKDEEYILCPDPALGVLGPDGTPGDPSAIGIYARRREEFVAEYSDRCPPDELAQICMWLAVLFKGATTPILIPLRAGQAGGALVAHITNPDSRWRKRVPFRMYRQEKTGGTGSPVTEQWGLEEKPQNRLALYLGLNTWLRKTINDPVRRIHNARILSEASTFQRNSTGKWQAAPGKHDDTLSTSAGCLWADNAIQFPRRVIPRSVAEQRQAKEQEGELAQAIRDLKKRDKNSDDLIPGMDIKLPDEF